MLTREELKKCLKEAEFSEEQIEFVLSKKIDTLLSRRSDISEMNKILQVLIAHEISKDAIINCLTLLARGNARKIEKVFEALDGKVSKDSIENCLLVLLGNAEEIEKVYQTLIKHKIDISEVESCLYVLAKGKADEVDEILTILEGKISKKAIENCLSLLASGRADEIKEILKVLENHSIGYEAIEKCLSVLRGGKKGEQAGKKAKEIDDILKFLEGKISKKAIENCLTLLIEGKVSQIEAIYNVLNKHKISKEAIENCLSIFIKEKKGNRAKEIDRILLVLEKNKIDKKAVENCLSVLGRGKADEIEAIFKVLNKYKISKNTIKRCLYVLAVGKAKEIDGILKLLKENDISEASIEKCLTVLTDGTVSKIKGIFAVFTKHGINKKIVEGCLSLLISQAPKKLEEMIEVLEQNGVEKSVIEAELAHIITARMSIEDVKEMFDDTKVPKDKDKHYKNIRRYMKLKKMYGRFYTKEEVEEFCNQKHITIEEFIIQVVTYPTGGDFLPIYYKELNRQGKIYVGGSTPIDKEYLEEHGGELIGLSRSVARKFANKTRYSDIAELESRALEAITERCGNLVNNLKNYPDELRACIFNKSMGCLHSVLHEGNLVNSLASAKVNESRNSRVVEEQYVGGLRNSINYEKAQFSKIETEVMENMIRLVEGGESENLYEKIAAIIIIDVEMVVDIVEQIKQKMLQKKLVRQRSDGGYEFSD
ncbi:MAG: hypothetical protein HFJ28_04765 [Clostridia bacterium]|nr:hypothetical protein [Clostridia bacterium]